MGTCWSLGKSLDRFRFIFLIYKATLTGLASAEKELEPATPGHTAYRRVGFVEPEVMGGRWGWSTRGAR